MEFKTLHQFIRAQQVDVAGATGELSHLLSDIALAAKVVNRAVNRAGLTDITGDIGVQNVQGETQQKLDVLAHNLFITALRRGNECQYVASEEELETIELEKETTLKRGKYIVCIDPLDGSSNIDINVSVGTIFSILHASGSFMDSPLEEESLTGRKQIAAGYILYGSSTMLVYTTGNGVHGFTLDPSLGEFCLSHPFIQLPHSGTSYSINEGNLYEFPESIRFYLDFCQNKHNQIAKSYTARYIGSMIADVHRILLKGGVFLYPSTLSYPEGKLRLLYECNPMAFIIEQAGGLAVDGKQAILDLPIQTLHQRCSFIAGSKDMVNQVLEFYTNENAKQIEKAVY